MDKWRTEAIDALQQGEEDSLKDDSKSEPIDEDTKQKPKEPTIEDVDIMEGADTDEDIPKGEEEKYGL